MYNNKGESKMDKTILVVEIQDYSWGKSYSIKKHASNLEKASEYQKIITQLKAIPEVIECHYTTGNYSLFIKMIAKDNENLMTLLTKKIQKIQGINRTETFISLEESINRVLLP